MAKVGAREQGRIGVAAKAAPKRAVTVRGLQVRDARFGKFMDVKRSSGAFKGVRREG